MEKFLQRWAKSKQSSTSSNANENVDPPSTNPSNSNINTNASEPSLTHSRELEKESNFEQPSSKYRRIEINLENLPADPGLRPSIYEYHPNDLEQIRRLYLQRGPCQPHFDPETLPYTLINGKKRRFNPDWFKDYPFWLEYSVEKDAVFCLYCYLFKTPNEKFGADAFISDGFRNWKKKEKLEYHVGGPKSAHNIAMEKCQNLLRQEGHIETLIEKKTDQDRTEYRIRLNASFEAVRYLLRQGLAFRGHNESASSKNQGNFIEYLKSLARVSDEIKEAVIENAPKNNKLTSPDIQKDLVNACAVETTKLILEDLGDDYFSILVDESRDVSIKEQMAIILRYVDKQGSIVERFLAIVHVVDTTSHNLKASIDAVFAKHRLSISKLRGQGYDGASNMRGEFNGLKSLILKENPSAHYIHCFAHQLQLALVGLSKYHPQVDYLFTSVNKIATTVGASPRRRDILREAQATKILEAIDCGERETGRGLNQEMAPKRLCDTRWSSHYDALVNLTVLWSSVKEALESITLAKWGEKKGDALALMRDLGSFEFAFCVHLVRNVLGITNELSIALQRKDQDILNAVNQVAVAKERLQEMRDIGWDSFLEEVSSFATEHDIDIPNMDDIFLLNGRQRRNAQDFKNFHHYRYDLFNAIIDIQLQELNNRFNEVNTELLLCVACLDPRNSFATFDKKRLLSFAKLYPQDFSPSELLFLSNQLENFIRDLRRDDEFSQLKGLGDLAKKMVETQKHMIFPLVYKLVKLVLILPVATASVERVFSAMNVVKSELRNRMGDEWLNDSLVTYIESETFDLIDKDVIFERFQKMKNRRGQL